MSGTLQQTPIVRQGRYQLAVDAFLFAAVIFAVAIGVQGSAAWLLAGANADAPLPSWIEFLGAAGMPVSIVGGALLAWWLHNGAVHGRHLVGALLGAVLGGAALGITFFALLGARRLINPPFARDDTGPWDLGIIVALATLGFLAKALLAAVREVRAKDRTGVRARLRLSAFAVVLTVVIVSLFIGGEGAEIGAFLVLVAVPAAGAALGMTWLRRRAPVGT